MNDTVLNRIFLVVILMCSFLLAYTIVEYKTEYNENLELYGSFIGGVDYMHYDSCVLDGLRTKGDAVVFRCELYQESVSRKDYIIFNKNGTVVKVE